VLEGGDGDFPVSMTVSHRDEMVYLLSRKGFIHIIDTHTGVTLYAQRIFSESISIFTSCSSALGLLAVSRAVGDVYVVSVDHVGVLTYALRDRWSDSTLCLQVFVPSHPPLHIQTNFPYISLIFRSSLSLFLLS
jgi:hypothetical protein